MKRSLKTFKEFIAEIYKKPVGLADKEIAKTCEKCRYSKPTTNSNQQK